MRNWISTSCETKSILSDGIAGNVDDFISETKIDDMFPAAQFFKAGYAPPYRLDRNCNKGGILLYILEDIPSRLMQNLT